MLFNLVSLLSSSRDDADGEQVFTSLPVAMLGIFEQDVGATPSLLFPALYQVGITGSLYTRVAFFVAMLDSVYQSCVCFWIPYFAYFGIPTASVTGHDVSLWEFGSCVAVAAVLVANNFVALQTRFFTWIIAVILVLSSLTVFVWIAIYSQFQTFTFEHVAGYLYSTLAFWASIVLVQILALLPRFAFRFARLQYRPTVADSIREYVLSRPRQAALEEGRQDLAEAARTPSLKEAQAESHEMATVVAGLPTISIRSSQEAPYAQPSPPRIRTESATSQDALARHVDPPSPGPSPAPSPIREDRPTSYDSTATGVTPSPSWATALDDAPHAM